LLFALSSTPLATVLELSACSDLVQSGTGAHFRTGVCNSLLLLGFTPLVALQSGHTCDLISVVAEFMVDAGRVEVRTYVRPITTYLIWFPFGTWLLRGVGC